MLSDVRPPTRQEITEKTDTHAQEMDQLHAKLEETAQDIETVRALIEQINPGGGTAEGVDQVEQSVDRAEDATEQVFDEQDNDLEKIHQDNADHCQEVEERGHVSEANLGKLSDAAAPLKTQEAVSEVRAAKESMLQDVDVLKEMVDHITENANRSTEIVERLRQIREGQG